MYLSIINKIFSLDKEGFNGITTKKIEFKQEISGQSPSALLNSIGANKTGKKEPVRGLK